MNKRFLRFAVIFIAVSILLYSFHKYLLTYASATLSYNLLDIYVFHFIASFTICAIVEWLSSKLPNQVGYIYLSSVFIKIGVFVLVFKSIIFGAENLPMGERISIIVPMFIFLIIEVVYSGRIMNAINNK